MFQTQNPYSLEVLQDYEYLTNDQIEVCLSGAFHDWEFWRKSSHETRAQALELLAGNLRERSFELASLISQEMGKPLRESLSEVDKCAVTTMYMAKKIGAWLQPEIDAFSNLKSSILKQSIGPILCIMPWNFPIWQVIRFAVPALAAGNVVLLKGSDLVAGTSELLGQIFRESFPCPGLFQNLRVPHEKAAMVLADPRIRAVTFTGSPRGGRQVAEVAGRNLKKVVLELGGNDPYVLLEDCDLEKSAGLCADSRMINTGQSCVAAKRFFVPESLRDSFLEVFTGNLAARKSGDPLFEETNLGVLAHARFKDQLEKQVHALTSQGARRLWRSNQEGKGAFFQPQVLEAKLELKQAHVEELFGPVALCFFYQDISHAVQATNSSPYGLGAAIFSKNVERAKLIAQDLEVGMVAINDFIKSDARLPFGGVKESGFGRELSQYGFQEFLNLKTLVQSQ